MKTRFLSFVVAFAIFAGIGAFITPKAYAASTDKTQARAVEWAKSQVGTKAVDMDGAYGAQCVDFIQHYYSFLGVSGGGGNACDYRWNSVPDDFTRIYDHEGFVPNPGDIAVWTKGYAGNECGHVGVVLSATLSTVTVADVYGSVNETPYRKVHQTTYSYYGSGMVFWGVIRPNFSGASAPTQTRSFAAVSDGTYFLYNRATNLALNLAWNNDANCENVHAYDYSTMNRGELMSVTSCSSDGKTYKIRPVDAKRLVQMYGEKPRDGVNVCVYDDLDNSTQWWKFEKVGNGYAIFIACDTNYALSSVSGDAVLNTYTGDGSQIWEMIPYSSTYTVNYNANGGSGSMPSETLYTGKDMNLSANKFTRSGYAFQGWSKSSTAAAASYSDKALVSDLAGGANVVTLYAVWKAVPASAYTIKYDGNGNTSGYMSDTQAACNSSVNLQKNGFKKFGSRFKGWSTEKNAKTAQFTDAQSVKSLAKSGTVTLYAVWEHIEVPQLTGLKASMVTKDSVTLTWDKLDVDGYDIWKDNVFYGKTTSNSITFTGLKHTTTYSFDVTPYIEGASSAVGQSKTVTTSSDIEAAAGAAGAAGLKDTSTPKSDAASSNSSSDTQSSTKNNAVAVEPSVSTSSGSPANTHGQPSAPETNYETSASEIEAVEPAVSDNSNNRDNRESTSAASPNAESLLNANASGTGETITENASQASAGSSSGETNNAAQTMGVGAIVSSSIAAFIHFLRKLLGK